MVVVGLWFAVSAGVALGMAVGLGLLLVLYLHRQKYVHPSQYTCPCLCKSACLCLSVCRPTDIGQQCPRWPPVSSSRRFQSVRWWHVDSFDHYMPVCGRVQVVVISTLLVYWLYSFFVMSLISQELMQVIYDFWDICLKTYFWKIHYDAAGRDY